MSLEIMRYRPSIKICLLTRGTLANGNLSKASWWSILDISQKIHQDGYYLYGRDTYDDQNPLIYFRPHLEEYADYYKAKIRTWFENWFPIKPSLIHKKNLRNPIVTELRQFDQISSRKVYCNEFDHTWNWKTEPHDDVLDKCWKAIVDCQSQGSDNRKLVSKVMKINLGI